MSHLASFLNHRTGERVDLFMSGITGTYVLDMMTAHTDRDVRALEAMLHRVDHAPQLISRYEAGHGMQGYIREISTAVHKHNPSLLYVRIEFNIYVPPPRLLCMEVAP